MRPSSARAERDSWRGVEAAGCSRSFHAFNRCTTMYDPWAPDLYILILPSSDVPIALVAWLLLALQPLSLSIVCICIGAAIFLVPQVRL